MLLHVRNTAPAALCVWPERVCNVRVSIKLACGWLEVAAGEAVRRVRNNKRAVLCAHTAESWGNVHVPQTEN